VHTGITYRKKEYQVLWKTRFNRREDAEKSPQRGAEKARILENRIEIK
jgi:hypothetical protein